MMPYARSGRRWAVVAKKNTRLPYGFQMSSRGSVGAYVTSCFLSTCLHAQVHTFTHLVRITCLLERLREVRPPPPLLGPGRRASALVLDPAVPVGPVGLCKRTAAGGGRGIGRALTGSCRRGWGQWSKSASEGGGRGADSGALTLTLSVHIASPLRCPDALTLSAAPLQTAPSASPLVRAESPCPAGPAPCPLPHCRWGTHSGPCGHDSGGWPAHWMGGGGTHNVVLKAEGLQE